MLFVYSKLLTRLEKEETENHPLSNDEIDAALLPLHTILKPPTRNVPTPSIKMMAPDESDDEAESGISYFQFI
jgi:hypothetical protein